MPAVILLAVNSSYTHTNPAVRCLKKSFLAHDIDCDFLEFSGKDRRGRILSALVGANAAVCGFSTYIWNRNTMLSLASDLKKLCPKTKIFFGGPEVSHDAEALLAEYPFIDCVVTGEGEDAAVEVVSRMLAGEPFDRVANGGVYEAFPSQGMIYERDELEGGGARLLYYESSRGCPFRCAYCLSALSGKVRAKSASVTLAELLEFETLAADIRVVKFVDRTFNFDAERAKAIWRGLLSPLYTKSYHFEICAELLDDESMEILRAFPKGKVRLEIGVQPTNPGVLARVSRHSDLPRLLGRLTELHGFGNLHLHADLIAGLPGEDYASIARSFNDLYGRCDLLQLGFLKLLRGSVLRGQAESFGCVYSDEPPYPVLATDTLSFAELERLHGIDELLDRLEGSLVRTMKLLTGRAVSPFSLYETLADRFAADRLHPDAIAQPWLFEKLWEYARLDEDDLSLAEALSLDFSARQNTVCPRFGAYRLLRADDAENVPLSDGKTAPERATARELLRRFRDFAARTGRGITASALEVRVLSADGTVCGVYVCGRQNGVIFAPSGENFVEV